MKVPPVGGAFFFRFIEIKGEDMVYCVLWYEGFELIRLEFL
jgi:hypothetical protein